MFRFNVLRDRTLELTAQTRIRAGEEISIQYVTPLLGKYVTPLEYVKLI